MLYGTLGYSSREAESNKIRSIAKDPTWAPHVLPVQLTVAHEPGPADPGRSEKAREPAGKGPPPIPVFLSDMKRHQVLGESRRDDRTMVGLRPRSVIVFALPLLLSAIAGASHCSSTQGSTPASCRLWKRATFCCSKLREIESDASGISLLVQCFLWYPSILEISSSLLFMVGDV